MNKPIYKYATVWGILGGTALAYLYLKTIGKNKNILPIIQTDTLKALLIGGGVGLGIGLGIRAENLQRLSLKRELSLLSNLVLLCRLMSMSTH